LGAIACSGRGIQAVADERYRERRAAIEDANRAERWREALGPEERAASDARSIAHHVYVQTRPDIVADAASLRNPEPIDTSPALDYPENMRRSGEVWVVLHCIVETTGLVSNCVRAVGPEDLSGHVRRTVSQWSFLPAIDDQGTPHAVSYTFALPFRS
jgi:hypothetical protein